MYNFYLGYYDGNPANLHPYGQVEMGKRYVQALGGSARVINLAKEANKQGDYRWSAELLKQVIAANPGDQVAKNLQADNFEQLGYQAESATWRGFYLTGAKELREGVHKFSHGTTGSRTPFAECRSKCCSTLCPFASIVRKPRVKISA